MNHKRSFRDFSFNPTVVATGALETLCGQIARNLDDGKARPHIFDADTSRVVDHAARAILN